VKWSHRKHFQASIPKWVATYGFQKNEDGEWIINEEQAVGVRRIFELYASGKSMPEVCRILAQEGIPSMWGGKWKTKSLSTVHHNEKYVGDIAMQIFYPILIETQALVIPKKPRTAGFSRLLPTLVARHPPRMPADHYFFRRQSLRSTRVFILTE
jgi:hypothetical protein